MTAPRPKIFCIGFQKTGTTSLHLALEHLGYRVAGVFGRDLALDDLRASYVQRGLVTARTHDAVEDMPWPLMFRELDAAFPGSRFILTWRETAAWIRSISNHFGDNPDVVQQLTYGADHPCPIGHEARYADVYDAHNAAVRDHFADRPDDLLEMNLAAGDGWEVLCGFLRQPVPDAAFPRANSTGERKSFGHRLRRRLRRLGLPLTAG